MILRPANLTELAETLAACNARGEKVTGFDLSALNSVIEHTPEDMTATVQAGMTLEALQRQLAKHGQWLAIDPPDASHVSIGAVLAGNASGPRRFGYGTVRDYLIGIKVVLADGRVIKSGGKVVKNVAGYDLAKLFVGSYGSLGVIVEAAFKLLPLPEVEQFVCADCVSLEHASTLLGAVNESPITPVVIDMHNFFASKPATRCQVVLGFAGTREEVAWQLAEASKLGIDEPGDLRHEEEFWNVGAPEPAQRISALPSRLIETLGMLGEVSFAARAGNGVICYRGEKLAPGRTLVPSLSSRLKAVFDPKGILPNLPQ